MGAGFGLIGKYDKIAAGRYFIPPISLSTLCHCSPISEVGLVPLLRKGDVLFHLSKTQHVNMALTLLLLIALLTSTAVYADLFDGPAFPAPSAFSSNSAFQDAVAAFDAALNNTLQNGISRPAFFNGLPLNKTCFSIAMFSPSNTELLYERHYIDPTIETSLTGAVQVNGDSVFRIGSISKLFTV